MRRRARQMPPHLSRLMALHFTQTESTSSYFEAVAKYLKVRGKPAVVATVPH
jgi:hypothetical protein